MFKVKLLTNLLSDKQTIKWEASTMNKVLTTMSVITIFLLFAAASSDSGSSGSSSSSSSGPYSSVRAALDICASRLRSDTASGKYNHLSDYEMARQMERDQERCMATYGHYPN